MKDSLLPIYRAVSEGRVTQADALEKIKALKQQRRDFVPELLLATRQWVPMRVSNPTRSTNRSRKVLVWGLSSDIVGSLRSRLDCELREIASQRAAAVDVAFSDAAVECFDAIKSLLSAQKAEHAGLLQLVVAEASAVSVAVGLEALLRTANEENPALGVQLLQVPADVDATELQLLCEREAALLDQISVRYRRERGVLERQVMRWQTKVAQSGGPVIFKEAGCYLITGGAGGIGLQFAREIALRTASATIVLAGRSEPSAKVAEDLRTIAARGHRIEYVSVDVTNAEAVETLVRRLETEGRPLNGIIHCAGITRDNFIIRKPIDEFATVLAPKVTGTVNLDRATRHTALDFLVLCSSVAACWGNGGQADYAAANGFMDAFAQHRNRLVQDGERRGRTLSVNWPLWQDGGMSLDAATWQRLQSRTGMRPLQTTSAMRALYEGFAIACDQLLVMEGELSSMQTLLDESDVKVAGADETPAPSARAPVASIHTDAAFKAKALEYLCQQFSRVLKIPVAKLRPHAPLEQYGMDSILAMKLVSHLETLFGRLPKTLAFEYQTIAELSEYFCSSHAARLAEALAPADSSRSVAAPRVAGKRLQEDRNAAFDARRSSKLQQSSKAQPSSSVAHVKDAEPIAIIGLSGRYPDAWNLDEYWQNLKQGKDCIGEVPPQRWRWQDYYRGDAASPGPHSSKWGGFISGADEFDPQFFNISPREAPYIDPQERLFLQHAWMAMEDAGYTRKSLQVPRANGLAGQVGVYVGVMYGEYNRSGSLASIANRVSYVLNLHGPSMTLDTMCSSSLTAIHLACQDLRTGGTDLAIAGGVNLSIHPGKYSMLSAGQFISSAGHCQSFGEGGDGYIPGEGVGAVILKRLSDAERDGDAIYAIIRGSALNHGGKTNGYTVPNPQAQAAVIGQALRDAGISARQVSYIEAHGTGTKLGDPIEIAALSKAFQQYTGDTQFCLLGSAKSNIGHCESAAGIAGLTKVVLQLRHRQIVPSLHSQRLNPNIDFERSPFIVNQQLRDWEAPVVDGKPVARIAGLSSFGAGGANAHLLVEEYTAPLKHESVQESAPCVVLLSARTLTQLQQKSRDLKAFIDNDPNIDLLSLAYTTQIGREAMDERVGILVSSREQLLERLALFAASASEDDGALADDMFYAQIKRHRDAMALFSADEDLQASVDGWFRAGKWSRLVDVWTKGLEIDWRRLYASSVPRRLHLPTYPFARERYWREDADERTDAIVVPLSGHSLLQQNISKPGQQRYRSLLGVDGQRYRGIELFGNPILSRGVLIEAARAALEDALPSFERSSALELHDVRLASPVETLEHVPVEISVLLPGQGRRPAPEDVAFEITSQSAEPVVLCQGLARECADEPAHVLDVASLLRRASPMLGDKNAVASACQSLGLEIAPLYQAVTSVHQATDGLLLTFESSDASRAAFADFVVQPAVLDGALIAAQWLRRPVGDGLYLPASIATLRCNVASQQPQYAWIQLSNAQPRNDAFSVDVTICDADGNVCASFGQLTLVAAKLQPAAEIDAPIAEPSEPTIHTPDRAFAALDKPTAIDLTTPEEIDALAVSSTLHKPALALAARADARDLDEGVSIVLDERGAGIFTLRLQRNEGRFDERLIGELEQALKRARDLPTIKALVIESDDQRLPSADQDVLASEAARALWHTLASFPYPTVAVLSKAASGAGFWIACVCDFVVAVDDQSYGLETADGWSLTQAWQRDWLDARFGEPFAALLAMNTSNLLGRELRDAGWGARVVAQAQVDGVVQELCQGLGEKTQSALRLLKQHMAMEFEARVAELSSAESSRAISAPRESVLQATSAPSCVESVRSDNNQVHLRLRSRNGTGTAAALLELRVALEACSGASAVLLSSELNEFLPEDAARHSQTLQQLVFAVLQLNAPIIAVLDRNATNAGFLLALACDAAVYSEGGRYGGLALRDHRDHLALLDEVTRQRLGVWASVWTLTGMMSGACELRQRLPMLEVCSADAVMDKAQQLADTLSAVSRDLFRRKTALVARIRQREQPYVEQATADALPTQEMRLALTSSVVRASVDADGVVLVHLEDRDAKNMFSDALIAGLQEVFEHVRQSLSYKAVVLVGYDTYFASGGTRDGLKAIHAGKVRFTDLDVFQLAMRCPLPVVAAMQGHGIGAGWTLGLFADCMVFSEESRYVSPYMNFGFTPGAGATGVLPLKLGLDLARDSLFTGREMLGSEIQQRNPLLTVVPRAQVLSDAMAIARSLSRHDRNDLLAWKAASTAHRLAAWEALFAREVAMHEATLVGQTDTLARIEQRFSPSASAPAKAEVSLSSASSQRVDVLPTIRRLLAEELRLGESDIEARTPFVDLGLDSISGVTWIRKINAEFGLAIEATKIYSHPNLQQLSRYIGELSQAHANIPGPSHIEPKAEVAVERVPTPVAIKKAGATFVGWEKLASWRDDSSVAASTSHSTPAQAPAIAVIGMAGRFPMAKDLERFWDNIANGKNCISEVPPSRWNMDALFVDGRAVLGQSSSKWMGVLEGHDQFDPLFFGLSPIEAEAMDPQQRLFLQCCWHGMENAGYTAERLSGSKCGVFVGCAHGDYNLLSREQQISALGFTGGAPSILAARVAYFLNLQGPCISIDTACSSSLVAIATACDSLITGASDVAFAGGVYVMANADMFLKTSHAGMLSPDGRCYTFDQRANGFVPGEGVGIVLLKRLADAERDGDRILAVVRGWGVNQDGKTNGITAPNADSQQRLIKDVYSRFSIDPRQIQLIEAHGTGTKLGDPIEIEALKSAFSAATQDRNYCAVGSVKTNIGHCLTAAGISGFIKLLLAIRHRQLPPSINFETPNEHLGLDNSPFYVNTALREWETPVEVPRQAAISSFGFSGTNAHIVLTEYTPPVSQAATSVVAPHAGFVIPISARTPEQLLQKARDLRDFMQAQRGLSLAELSSSLQLNRDPMEERLCFVAHDVPQAIDDLSIYIDAAAAGKPLPVQLFAANIKQGRESIRLFSEDDDVRTLVIDKCIAEGGMSRLCELWVKGLVLDWRKLYGSHRPSSISLPLYPFAAESYWVTPTVPSIDAVSVRGSELPRKFHPLLHEKVADIADQGYRQDASADDSLMDGDKKIRLMHLPTYAFARMRCWFSSKESLRSSDSARVVPLPTPHRRLGKGLDSIAELFTELEQGKVTTGEVVKRVKSLA